MSSEEQQLLQFDDYLLGRMGPEARDSFERELKTNQFLAMAFQDYQNTIFMIKRDAFMADALSITAEEKQATKKAQRTTYLINRQSLIAIAASVAVLVVAAYVLVWFDAPETMTFELLYKPYPNVMQQRNKAKNRMEEAFVHYSMGEFAEALSDFRQVTHSSDTVAFYSGICLLSLGDNDEAIILLESIYGNSETFGEQINWYLALAYYRRGDFKMTVIYLKKIQSGEYKYEESNQLLQSEKKLRTFL